MALHWPLRGYNIILLGVSIIGFIKIYMGLKIDSQIVKGLVQDLNNITICYWARYKQFSG
jgi:hypothetical protein